MSPEQVGAGELDGRSDLFSVGLILYELVTGEKAFRADTVVRAVQDPPRGARPPPHPGGTPLGAAARGAGAGPLPPARGPLPRRPRHVGRCRPGARGPGRDGGPDGARGPGPPRAGPKPTLRTTPMAWNLPARRRRLSLLLPASPPRPFRPPRRSAGRRLQPASAPRRSSRSPPWARGSGRARGRGAAYVLIPAQATIKPRLEMVE